MHRAPSVTIARVGLVAVLALVPTRGLAQGRTAYFNVESPQVHPVATAEVGGETYLLVCNTPDNSVELYATDESLSIAERFLQRIPVGLEPVSVAVLGERFYTANFLGDSVTAGRLVTTEEGVRAVVERTQTVGDEPVDLDLFDLDGQLTLFVTHHGHSSVGWFDARTLDPEFPDQSSFRIDLVQSTGAPPFGLKEPRVVRVRDDRLHVLGFKGGVTHPDSNHDLDLLIGTIGPPVVFSESVAGLGSHNFDMAFSSSGDLYVVGGEAQSFVLDDKIAAREEPTGFVRSTLYRLPAGGGPTFRRDLNRTSGDPAEVVERDAALAMPTAVLPYEVDGVVTKVFLTAFGSDRLGVLAPSGDPVLDPDVAGWQRRTVDYSTPEPIGGNPRWGPRGLALGRTAQGDRLFVLNRLDHSVSVFDPVSETEIGSFPLRNDPTPEWIRQGRHFLYSAELSGNGFVSCASCHLDGRTDNLAWRLGNPAAVPPLEAPPPDGFIFGSLAGPSGGPDTFLIDMLSSNGFDPQGLDDKREMVTQTLQGLVNFEVAPQAQRYFTNAPYHWRGDKPSLLDFNEAFVTLMGAPDLEPGGAEGPKGLTDDEMLQFEEFVLSIAYPPNPQQHFTRRLQPGSPAEQGLELFHTFPIPLGRGRACGQCHMLPAGTNNRIALVKAEDELPGYVERRSTQPMQVAALRGLFQFEALLQRSGTEDQLPEVTPRIGHYGIGHTGGREIPTAGELQNVPLSINTFIDTSALAFGDDFESGSRSTEIKAIKQFVHELDWGIAPIVGTTLTVGRDNARVPSVLFGLRTLLDQAALAHAGLAVQARLGSEVRGFWYHPVEGAFVEEPTGLRLSPPQMLDLPSEDDDQLTFLATPLGSDRRVAAPSGVPGAIPGTTPGQLTLLPMTVGATYAALPSITANWIPPDAPTPFTPAPEDAFRFTGPIGAPFVETVRLLQYGLIAAESDYGLDGPRHEAPRRFRVSGNGLSPGAVLHLHVPDPPPDWKGISPSEAVARDDFPTLRIELPLYPTSERDASGRPIWQTAVEVAPYDLYVLMHGGFGAPGVQRTIDFTICRAYSVCGALGLPDPEPVVEPTLAAPEFDSPFDTDRWNWHYVEVVQPTGERGDGGWQQITLAR